MQNATKLINSATRSGSLSREGRKWLKSVLQSQQHTQHLRSELSELASTVEARNWISDDAHYYLKQLIEVESRLRGKWQNTVNIKAKVYKKVLQQRIEERLALRINKLLWGGDQKLALVLINKVRKIRSQTAFMKLEDIFTLLQFDFMELMGSVIAPIDVHIEQAGCYERANITCAYLVGLDIIRSPFGNFVLESNVSPGVNENRRAVYDEDPIVDEIITMAKNLGAQTVVWNLAWLTDINPWLQPQLFKKMKDHNLSLRISIDPRFSEKATYEGVSTKPAHELAEGKTLIVRTRDNLGGQDLFLGNKKILNSTLHRHKKAFPDSHFDVAEMSPMPKEEWITTVHPGLPNLVYKYVQENKGIGVYFIKANSCEHALSEAKKIDNKSGLTGGMFQRFTCSHLIENKHLYDIRSFILVSPKEVRFAGCLRRESQHTVPEFIEDGMVPNSLTFLTNVSAGNSFKKCPEDEVNNIKLVSLDIAKVIQKPLVNAFKIYS